MLAVGPTPNVGLSGENPPLRPWDIRAPVRAAGPCRKQSGGGPKFATRARPRRARIPTKQSGRRMLTGRPAGHTLLRPTLALLRGEERGEMLKAGMIILLALALTLPLSGPAIAKDKDGVTVIPSSKNDVSPRLATIPPKTDDPLKDKKERPLHGFPRVVAGSPDTAVQSTVSTAAPAVSSSFEGIGQGLAGFTVRYAPPDTNGAVGPNHFVQTVNVSFAVFSKTGTVIYGPASINTLFAGFGGLCETDNDGDPSVVYDQLADRWVITQFAVFGANGSSVPYLECIAVSTSGDPTGAYFRYSFPGSLFPD